MCLYKLLQYATNWGGGWEVGTTLHILVHCGWTHFNTMILTTPDPLSAEQERWRVQSIFHVQCVVKFVMQYEKIEFT